MIVNQFTVGPSVLSCWQSAANKLQRKEDRISLWNELFETALQEGLWDDVRHVSQSQSTRCTS